MKLLSALLAALAAIIIVYSALFHVLMSREGAKHTWFTGVYWTLQTSGGT